MFSFKKYISDFTLGILVGAIAMYFIAARVNSTILKAIESGYALQEENTATLAAKQDQWIEAAMSFRNVAAASSNSGNPFGLKIDHCGLSIPFWLELDERTFKTFIEVILGKEDKREKRYQEEKSAINFASYAYSLEKAGQFDLANIAWIKTMRLNYFSSLNEAKERANKHIADLIKFSG